MTKFRKLGRHAAHRMSMLRTMVSQLAKHGCLIQANEVMRLADNMVQLGKEGNLSSARRAAAFVHGDNVFHKLFAELVYRDRDGGYTRLLRTRIRVGDAEELYGGSCADLLLIQPCILFHIARADLLTEKTSSGSPQPPQRTPHDPRTKSKLSA